MAKNSTIIKNRYDKAHMKQFLLKFHLANDADVIEKLSSVPNMQGYIRQLVRDDITRTRTDSVPSTPFAVPEIDDKTKESIADEIIRTCF